jgi:SAM-dependent methyltransferase
LFDRVLIVHGLEESDDPARLLAEAGRVMTASGRLVIAAAARGGLWAGVERTPFGHGRPFTRGQLERLVRDAGLEPLAWSKALYAPPWKPLARWADSLEQIGARVLPALAGVILLEAVKQTYALQGRGRVAVAHAPVGAVLEPQPAGRNANRDLARRGEHR